jgi:hypothetical protein
MVVLKPQQTDALRGNDGENSDAIADFFVISNQGVDPRHKAEDDKARGPQFLK